MFISKVCLTNIHVTELLSHFSPETGLLGTQGRSEWLSIILSEVPTFLSTPPFPPPPHSVNSF